MKKLLVIGIVVVMVMGMAVAASAVPVATPDETIKMGLTFANGTLAEGTVTVGTATGASDGYVVGEDLGFAGAVNGAGEMICTDLAASTEVPDARYKQNLKAPLTQKGMVQVWHLKAYVNGASTGTGTLKAWMTSTGKIDSADYTVNLWDGDFTADQIKAKLGAKEASLWTPAMGTSGTSSNAQYTLASQAVSGFRIYTVSINTPVVPEPGSMMALFSGLVGLVGFGIRRRK